MHKRRTSPSNVAAGNPARALSGGKGRGVDPHQTSQGYPALFRETIESVAIAFVLAFLFRTFEAEAFVIPTGSMAPTLMGRHKDLTCPKCGCPYQVNASDEVDSETGAPRPRANPVAYSTCPMCRYTTFIGASNPQDEVYPSYNGDRILVGKFAYQIADPQRWDVAVFKYPGGAKMNFIKRIVGLPQETVRIQHGDLFIQPDGQKEFHIARKPPAKILAVSRPVYDNDYVFQELLDRGWPLRWQPVEAGAGGSWQASADHRSLATDGTASNEVWVRYHNFVPTPAQWDRMQRRESLDQDPPQRQLVSDFVAYNAGGVVGHRLGEYEDSLGMHWVGDLSLECSVEVKPTEGSKNDGQQASRQLILELVEGGRRFRCTLDLATGQALLAIDGLPQYAPRASTSVQGPGTYNLRFSNFDDELLLWVNNRVVAFDAPTAYLPLNNTRPQPLDLAPVAIGARGAALEVRHLRVHRDLYYIAQGPVGSRVITDYRVGISGQHDVQRLLSDPRQWSAFDNRVTSEYKLDADQFLVLGDNSPKSKDSRLWSRDCFEHYVRRDLLIGKALYIYWPHSWGTWQNPIPGFPNFARMNFIR